LKYLKTINKLYSIKQYALDWHHNPDEMRRRYQASFMSRTSSVTKVNYAYFCMKTNSLHRNDTLFITCFLIFSDFYPYQW